MGVFESLIVLCLGTLLVLALVAGVVIFANALRRRGQLGAGQPASAREVLDERYARGELTREQYQQMVDDLRIGRD